MEAEIQSNKNPKWCFFDIIKKNAKQGDFDGLDEKALKKMFEEGLSKRGFNDREEKTIARLSELWIDGKTKRRRKNICKNTIQSFRNRRRFYKHERLNSKMDDFLLWMDKNLKKGVNAESTAKKLQKC